MDSRRILSVGDRVEVLVNRVSYFMSVELADVNTGFIKSGQYVFFQTKSGQWQVKDYPLLHEVLFHASPLVLPPPSLLTTTQISWNKYLFCHDQHNKSPSNLSKILRKPFTEIIADINLEYNDEFGVVEYFEDLFPLPFDVDVDVLTKDLQLIQDKVKGNEAKNRMLLDRILFECLRVLKDDQKLELESWGKRSYKDYFIRNTVVIEAKSSIKTVDEQNQGLIQLFAYMMQSGCNIGFLTDSVQWQMIALIGSASKPLIVHLTDFPEVSQLLSMLFGVINDSVLFLSTLLDYYK